MHMKFKKLFLTLSLSSLLVSGINYQNKLENVSALTSNVDISDLNDTNINKYYQGVAGLQGKSLQSALHNIIKDHTAFTYSETVNIMKITDRDWDLSPLSNAQLKNYPFTTHTGIGDPYLKLLYGTNYNGTTNAVKWSEDHVKIWNKEHTWAKSHGDFGEKAPAGTDLHHLIAADAQLNRYHSNYDYGIPTIDVTPRNDVRALLTSGSNGKNADSPTTSVFLPPEEDRGDIARALFYMETRYYEFVSNSDPKLELVNETTSLTHEATKNTTGKMGWEKVLLEWHYADPVDEYEIHRNNLIYNNFQGNRNPFIDHPEWAEMIFDPSYSGSGASLATNSSCTKDYCSFSADTPIREIEISNLPNKLTFYQDELFDLSGLVIKATFEDDLTMDVMAGDKNLSANFDHKVLTDVGTFTVTLTYGAGEKIATTNYQIEVIEDTRKLVSFAVESSEFSLTPTINDVIDFDTLSFSATYTEATTGDDILTKDLSISDIIFKLDDVELNPLIPNLGFYHLGEHTLSFTYQMNKSEVSEPVLITVNVTNVPLTSYTLKADDLNVTTASYENNPNSFIDEDGREFRLSNVKRSSVSDGNGIQVQSRGEIANLDPISNIQTIIITFSENKPLRDIDFFLDFLPDPDENALAPEINGNAYTYTVDAEENYRYFVLKAKTHTLYIDNISISYSLDADYKQEAETFINYFLGINDLNSLAWNELGRFYSSLSLEAKNYIFTNESSQILQTKNRYISYVHNNLEAEEWLKNEAGELLPVPPIEETPTPNPDPDNEDDKLFGLEPMMLIIIVAAILVVLIILLILVPSFRKKAKKKAKAAVKKQVKKQKRK